MIPTDYHDFTRVTLVSDSQPLLGRVPNRGWESETRVTRRFRADGCLPNWEEDPVSKGGWPVGVVDVSDFSGGSPLGETALTECPSWPILIFYSCTFSI